MPKALVVGIALAMAVVPILAQSGRARNCLHGPTETAGERARRQQAIEYATKVNIAEGQVVALLQRGYRALDQLTNVPAVPSGFDVQFHYDERSYTLALKDSQDVCHYAVFTDQDRLIYEAVPNLEPNVVIVPLGTR